MAMKSRHTSSTDRLARSLLFRRLKNEDFLRRTFYCRLAKGKSTRRDVAPVVELVLPVRLVGRPDSPNGIPFRLLSQSLGSAISLMETLEPTFITPPAPFCGKA